MLPQNKRAGNLEPAAFRRQIAALGWRERARFFAVPLGCHVFICPASGREYTYDKPLRIDSSIWTRCHWCDSSGRLRGEAGFNPDCPSRHVYPLEANNGAL